MSSNILEQSLDDIIGEKQHQRKFVPSRRRGNPNFRRGGGGAGVSSRGNRHHPYRSNPSIRRDTDSYIPRPAVSSSSSIPKQVSLLANGRPTLRIKNIHPELNGEDLSNLFSSISPVDFVKFDDDNDTIAYICFQNDCERSNLEAIAKFDGKKAMGKLLIVENTTSLLDRIDTRNINHRITSNGPLHSSHRSYSHSHPRGTSSGRRPPRERKVGGKTRAAKKTAEDLDKELENYMGNTTDTLDQELDNYMQETTTTNTNEPSGEQVATSTTNDEMTLD